MKTAHPVNTTQTLLNVPAGKRVRVKNLVADGPMRARLCSMGFTPGVEVEVCPECSDTGARRVRMRNSSLVLGESTANSIICECCLSETDLAALCDPNNREGTAILKTCCPTLSTGEHTTRG